MAFETFEDIHRPEGLPATVQEPASGKIAEIMCGQVGEQGQPHIGRRGPVRNDAAFKLLKVVGWQSVVCGGYKLREECPGLSCGFMEKGQLLFCQIGPVICNGFAQTPDEGWGKEPQ